MHTIARLAVVAATALAGGMSAPAISAQANVQANAQGERVIGNIIDSLIGTRYAVNDRYAIRRCGWAAVDKAERQYRPQFRGRHGFAYPGYHGYVRVTAITDVHAACSTGYGSRGCSTPGAMATATAGAARTSPSGATWIATAGSTA